MHVEQAQACTHHERIRLADEISLLARRQLNRRNQRTAGGDDAEIRGAGEVAVGSDEAGAVIDEADSLKNHVIVVGIGFADNNIVGVDVVHGDAHVVKRVDKTGAADNIGAAAGSLRMNEFGCGLGAGVEMAFINLQSQTQQLLLQLLRTALAGVGQEQKAFLLLIQPADELLDTGQQTVAVIDNAVHIADVALFTAQLC